MKLSSLLHTNWWATFRLNYKAGGWGAVRRMPIRVYGRLKMTLEGDIVIPEGMTKNQVVINSEYEDYTASAGKSELNLKGTLKVKGRLNIGPDCCIALEKGALLEMGDGVYLGRDSEIHCYGHTLIDDRVFAGKTYVCDSTIHQVFAGGVAKPQCGEVIIGNGTYLAFGTVILKGSVIPPLSVVGSGAVCTSDYSKCGNEKLFICGNPAVVKAMGVTAIL